MFSRSGFLLKGIAIAAIWIILLFAWIFFTRTVTPKRSAPKQSNAETFVVGSVRLAINSFIVNHNVVPVQLDSADDGEATPDNPFFTMILRQPVTSGWTKKDYRYTSPSGLVFIYDFHKGTFKKE